MYCSSLVSRATRVEMLRYCGIRVGSVVSLNLFFLSALLLQSVAHIEQILNGIL